MRTRSSIATLLMVATLSACSAPSAPQAAPAPNNSSTAPQPAPATSASQQEAARSEDITKDFKQFLSVDYAGAPWLKHVTKAEVKTGAVWVHTDLVNDSDVTEWGKSICTAGRMYGFDKGIKQATSRAVDGQRLAMC